MYYVASTSLVLAGQSRGPSGIRYGPNEPFMMRKALAQCATDDSIHSIDSFTIIMQPRDTTSRFQQLDLEISIYDRTSF